MATVTFVNPGQNALKGITDTALGRIYHVVNDGKEERYFLPWWVLRVKQEMKGNTCSK